MKPAESSSPTPVGQAVLKFDPCVPVPFLPDRQTGDAVTSRQNQRQRRSLILATIRQLLVEQGVKGVTIRRIAMVSGLAVQTIYNLVGPRDEAIIEAISEYTRYVGRMAFPDLNDADAVVGIIDRWLASISAAPEFCRQVSLIFFTDSRPIFYALRDRELKGMQLLLKRQQESGILRGDANLRELAEQLILFASALSIEWSDRPFPLDQLRQRLSSGFANLLDGAVGPAGLQHLRLVGTA